MFKVTPLFILFILLLPICIFAQNIKDADLAGSWYSNNPQTLNREINNYLDAAKVSSLEGDPIALILPHAGLIYSGKTLAYGFKALEGKIIDTVILIGLSHRVDFDGIAIFSYQGFKTPLGTLAIDKKLTDAILSADKKIFTYKKAFENENSIEIIIPFIQIFFDQPKAVLLAMGRQSWENIQVLSQALSKVLKDESNYLIIASTDMSHYLPLSSALKTDQDTIELLKKMDPEDLFASAIGKNRMCGLGPVVSSMIVAKKIGANKLNILNQSNSAEVNQDENRVIGYLSAVMVRGNNKKIEESSKMKELLNAEQKKKLLKLARNTIAFYLDKEESPEVKTDEETLKEVMGVFVTLRKNNQLRGCIGNIIGTNPLYLGVKNMAIAAATQDYRFTTVTKEELEGIQIEISVLSPLKQITNIEEIILGKHGVLVKDGYRSGVYLPQVATETGWNKEEFMNSLCGQKAGMELDAWKSGKCEIYIFSAEVFEE